MHTYFQIYEVNTQLFDLIKFACVLPSYSSCIRAVSNALFSGQGPTTSEARALVKGRIYCSVTTFTYFCCGGKSQRKSRQTE